jgi:hypothetical protein
MAHPHKVGIDLPFVDARLLEVVAPAESSRPCCRGTAERIDILPCLKAWDSYGDHQAARSCS